jgi:hypothetical protein
MTKGDEDERKRSMLKLQVEVKLRDERPSSIVRRISYDSI